MAKRGRKPGQKNNETEKKRPLAANEIQFCTKCGTIKYCYEFSPAPSRATHWHQWCNQCFATKTRATRATAKLASTLLNLLAEQDQEDIFTLGLTAASIVKQWKAEFFD